MRTGFPVGMVGACRLINRPTFLDRLINSIFSRGFMSKPG